MSATPGASPCPRPVRGAVYSSGHHWLPGPSRPQIGTGFAQPAKGVRCPWLIHGFTGENVNENTTKRIAAAVGATAIVAVLPPLSWASRPATHRYRWLRSTGPSPPRQSTRTACRTPKPTLSSSRLVQRRLWWFPPATSRLIPTSTSLSLRFLTPRLESRGTRATFRPTRTAMRPACSSDGSASRPSRWHQARHRSRGIPDRCGPEPRL